MWRVGKDAGESRAESRALQCFLAGERDGDVPVNLAERGHKLGNFRLLAGLLALLPGGDGSEAEL
jgi:hypothetical protein